MTPTLTALEIFAVGATIAKDRDFKTLTIAATERVINSEHNDLATIRTKNVIKSVNYVYLQTCHLKPIPTDFPQCHLMRQQRTMDHQLRQQMQQKVVLQPDQLNQRPVATYPPHPAQQLNQ